MLLQQAVMEVFRFPRTLSGQLRFYMAVASCAALALNGWFSYAGSRRALEQQIDALAMSRLHLTARISEAVGSRIGALVGTIAARQRVIGSRPHPDTIPFLAQVLAQMPKDVFSVYVAFEDLKFGEPDAVQAVNRVTWPAQVLNFGQDHHDPAQEWYAGAKKAGELYAALPYYDDGRSNTTLAAFTMPVYADAKKLIGVAGVDVTLEQQASLVSRLQEYGHGGDEYAYLVSRAGNIIIHPSARLMLRRGFGGADVRTLPEGQDIAARPSGFCRRRIGGDTRRIYWSTMPLSGSKAVLNVSEQKALAPVAALTVRAVAGDTVVLGFMLLLVSLIVGGVTKPVRRLSRAVDEIARGTFDPDRVAPLTTRRDELGEFARGFRVMAGEIATREQRLADWNANLSLTVAERTAELAHALDLAQQSEARLAAELAEAAAYVASLLPARLERPVRSEWVFIPSRLLGGDAFGYHWLDDHRLAIYLLDVCGHGVGAALLSISVMNVLRSQSLPRTDFGDPGSVLTALNQHFPSAEQNEMNFTAWYGVYDHERREVTYVTGGHPPALLVVPSDDGELRELLGTPNFMVGMVPGARYESQTSAAPPGSRLFVFSDGIYEVCSPSGTWLDFDQFLEMLVRRSTVGGGGLAAVLQDVRGFQQSETFEDDCSIVAFEFSSEPSPGRSAAPAGDGYTRIAVDNDVICLSVRNELDEVIRSIDFLEQQLEPRGVPSSLIHVAQVVADELITNVIRHGYRDDKPHTIDLSVVVRENTLTLRLSDDGIPFDPFSRPPVDVNRPIAERPIGGLGIHLVRQLSADYHYARVEGRNEVTVTLREPRVT